MKCIECPYYHEELRSNRCDLTESECYKKLDNCTLANDDGTINLEDEYFKLT